MARYLVVTTTRSTVLLKCQMESRDDQITQQITIISPILLYLSMHGFVSTIDILKMSMVSTQENLEQFQISMDK